MNGDPEETQAFPAFQAAPDDADESGPVSVAVPIYDPERPLVLVVAFAFMRFIRHFTYDRCRSGNWFGRWQIRNLKRDVHAAAECLEGERKPKPCNVCGGSGRHVTGHWPEPTVVTLCVWCGGSKVR